MRKLLACTCLTPVFLVSAPVAAETVISSATTTPVSTSTVKNGARDDIRISSAGSVKPASGVAVTLDSANNVRNEGTIQFTGVNDATGILAAGGGSGTITNSGKIILDENYTAADADKDGDLDGPFAQGARRYGIRVDNGGTFTGSVVNSGAINVEGNDSAGILVRSRLAGSVESSGSIDVLGDRSVGVRAGDVTGSVKLSGTIAAKGAGAVGASLEGNIGGALIVQGGISSTGYRNTAPTGDTSKFDADDLLQGGPALRIAGDVGGGILFEARPADNDSKDNDEDNDGVEDAKEGTASIISSGAAPAVQIGAADRSVTVGAVAGNASGHGLVINGSIVGNGVYRGVDANGLVIGGLGGRVSIAGGATVNGAVSASAVGASATALRLGRRASLGELRVNGSIAASGGAAGNPVRAVSIDAGASLGAIRNKGKITAATGADGSATAIRDASGTLAMVENSGAITASGASAAERNVAIDLRARANGATIRQLAVGQGVAAPSITGNILFGAGDNLLDIADGSVSGSTSFGSGSDRIAISGDASYQGEVLFGSGNDKLSLAGTSSFAGKADFGDGSDLLTLAGSSRFTGTLVGSSGLALTMTGGTLNLENKGAVALASLSLSGDSGIGVIIDPAAGTHTQYQVAGAASFGAGSRIAVKLASVSDAEGRYVVVKAGSLSGTAALATAGASLPYMFKSSISADQAAGEIAVDIKRKTAVELGLNGSQSRAYDAIADALDSDRKVADSFLAIGDGESFKSTLMQMLPDHAGGAFEMVTQGSRATARTLADPMGPLADRGGWGFWVQQVGWGTSKDLGDTGAYDVSGWGAALGAEVITTSLGNFGGSIAYLGGRDDDGASDNEVRGDQYEAAAYWRLNSGGFHADARVSYAQVDFTGTRRFAGTVDGEEVTRTAKGEWDGRLFSASGGTSYEMRTGRLSLRPALALDYYRLKEDSYLETGGGDAFNLSVDGRTSDELAGTLSLAAGLNFGALERDSGWFRAEIEGGRRELVGGSIGSTTARFQGGEDFTLLPEQREDGWVGRLRLLGGSPGFHVGGEFSAEEQQGRAAVAFRASLQLGL